MKILFFINTLGSGGKERRLTELLKKLTFYSKVKFELVIMSSEIHYKEVYDLGINIHYLIRKTRFDLFVFYRFFRICRNYNPDIVHCWDSMTAIYSVPVCKLLRIRFINGMVTNAIQRQSSLNKDWLKARLTFPFSDYIVGNSIAGLKAYNSPESKSIVIYNGFNFERLKNIIPVDIIKKQLKISTKYVVGMVAAFSEYKDYKTYYIAAQLLLGKRKDITFLAIGNKTDSEDSRDIIDKQYVKYFRLLGKKSDIESYINAMDIGILATFTEGISNSILEYMAMGKPVIATSGGGTSEIVIDNKTGFLINQSDPGDLAGKVELLLDDTELRKTMGSAGKKQIMETFSIDQMTEKYMNLFKKCLK